MRHADLRREATAVIAKPALPLLYDTAAVWYLVPGMGAGVCALWWEERCNGLKKHV